MLQSMFEAVHSCSSGVQQWKTAASVFSKHCMCGNLCRSTVSNVASVATIK
jgi:hypothetical protein